MKSTALFKFCTSGVLGLVFPLSHAIADEMSDWQNLQKMQQTAQRQSYQGTLVTQSGPHVVSSRITHITEGSSEYERIETLDGKAREWIRYNDEVQLVNPETKVIKQEKRRYPDRIPSLLTANLDELSQLYIIKTGPIERVAGVECTVVDLEPKDSYRYGYRFCIDKSTGLTMRSQTVNDQKDVLEQVVFSDFKVLTGSDKVKPKFKQAVDGWKLESPPGPQTQNLPLACQIKASIPGFKKVLEFRRVRPTGREVNQFIYSDGLTSVSLFVEPADTSKPVAPPIVNHGAVRSQTRKVGEWSVMAMGEVPAQTIKQFINSVEIKPVPNQ